MGNMCKVEYELKYKLEEIRGNKMKKYKQFTDDMVEKRDEIIHDLKGKASEVYDWENQVNKGSLDLERLEDAFILELQNDFKQAGLVNDGLKALKDGFGDLSAEFTALSVKIGKAHIDCEEQAPCMAVPVCKLHAASGSSCADIVNKNKREKTALKVSLARHNGDKGVVSYSNFKIAAERQKYQLQSADGFKDDECGVKVGNSFAGMSFGNQGYGRNDVAKTVHVGMKFSTPDQDNDKSSHNCAKQD